MAQLSVGGQIELTLNPSWGLGTKIFTQNWRVQIEGLKYSQRVLLLKLETPETIDVEKVECIRVLDEICRGRFLTLLD